MRHLALLLSLYLNCPATAGVVSRDLFEPGDGLLTYDDVNQREWLDFSVTESESDNTVLSRLGRDGDLSGFQWATNSDVHSFATGLNAPWELISGGTNNLQIVFASVSALPLAEYSGDHELLAAIGATAVVDLVGNSFLLSYGRTAFDGTVDGLDRRSVALAGRGLVEDGRKLFSFLLIDRVSIAASPTPISGYWLYRDAAPIPEPTTAWLMLAACLAALRLRAFA
ncbi:hypothetical protein MalM25_30960 [Planctomycetes bacterium MalM25]|nr:hypothetical protein MalM25_30960 [Planctomycetes bacterium MalM25]